jgi:hypothetical protein
MQPSTGKGVVSEADVARTDKLMTCLVAEDENVDNSQDH